MDSRNALVTLLIVLIWLIILPLQEFHVLVEYKDD